MTERECRDALASADFGRLACTVDDHPYIVPVYFVIDDDSIYSFALLGQKVSWMRENPNVCLEIDKVETSRDWCSVVVFGRFDELSDPQLRTGERARAEQLLKNRPMWWQPGATSLPNADKTRFDVPILYRIGIERFSGRRGVPSAND